MICCQKSLMINEWFKKMRKLIIIFCLFTLRLYTFEIKIELISQIYLNQDKVPIGRIRDITINEKNEIVMVDDKVGNIKIYNEKGELVRSIGRRGAGPGEFVNPYGIDYKNGVYCVQDIGSFKYVILNKEFEEIKRFFYLINAGDDIVLDKGKVITWGYYRGKDGKEYLGAIHDMKGNFIKTLLPYPFPSGSFERSVGADGFVSVSIKGDIYAVERQDVEIYKFTNDGILIKKFGIRPSFFKKCKRTKDFDEFLKWGRAPKGIEAARTWRKQFSWIVGLTMFDEFLGIVISNYNKQYNKFEYFMQIYNFNGDLLEEGIKINSIGSSSDECFTIESNKKDTIYVVEGVENEIPKFRLTKLKVVKK